MYEEYMRNVKSWSKMCKFNMFITAVVTYFLLNFNCLRTKLFTMKNDLIRITVSIWHTARLFSWYPAILSHLSDMAAVKLATFDTLRHHISLVWSRRGQFAQLLPMARLNSPQSRRLGKIFSLQFDYFFFNSLNVILR